MKLLEGAGALLVIALIAGAALIYRAQRTMMFPGAMRSAESVSLPEVAGIEQLWLPDVGAGQGEGAGAEAWFVPPASTRESPGAPAPAVLFAHGNGELIDDWPFALSGFAELGIGLLLVEYPGYGRSAGSPSRATIHATMLAAHDALSARPDVDPQRIVLYGRSLGGGAVCSILDERPVAALILQSTFTRVADLAWEIARVPAFLVRDAMNNREAVARYPGPVLVIHGRDDEIIPYHHGVALAEAARDGRLVTYACGHNDCPPSWRRFWSDIAEFSRDVGLLD